MNNNVKQVRDSNFELLRIVAMIFILVYHCLFFFVCKEDGNVWLKASWIPLHVAVICFVLISGYYHIKPSIRGLVKLIGPLLVFYLPLTIYELLNGEGGVRNMLFLSGSPYWFIRIYLYLFLLSPLLNSFLTTDKHRIYTLLTTGFLSVYMGMVNEPSLADGKNVVLFSFVYTIGDCLSNYKHYYEKYSIWLCILIYFIYNVILMSGYAVYNDGIIGKIIWRTSYPYHSPLLILNAVLLFVIFSKIKIRSQVVNWLGSSVLAVYVIHHQHFVLYSIIKPMALTIDKLLTVPGLVFLALLGFAFIILLVSILLDKLVTPIWKILSKAATTVELRLTKLY